jgi:hypothetical protein
MTQPVPCSCDVMPWATTSSCLDDNYLLSSLNYLTLSTLLLHNRCEQLDTMGVEELSR